MVSTKEILEREFEKLWQELKGEPINRELFRDFFMEGALCAGKALVEDVAAAITEVPYG